MTLPLGERLIYVVLALSLGLQLLAAVLALRLVRLTGSAWAWLLIAGATVLMATRRAVTLSKLLSGAPVKADLSAELIALSISVCLVLGIALIRPLFTHMRRVEEQLRRREKELRDTLDRAPDGIALVREGRWAYVNEALASALGARRMDLIGQGVEDRLSEADRSRSGEGLLRGASPGGSADPVEVAFVREDGASVTMEVVEGPTLEHEGEPARLLLLRDTTERRRLEAELLHTQKMEAVGRLAGGIAHDFNNLLTVVIGGASLARSDVPAGSDAHRSLGDVLDASRRASALARQLLAFSRKDPAHPQVIDPARHVEAATSMMVRLLGEDIELRTDLADVGRVYADGGQLDQVLVNLIVNARDAMTGGGTIEISTRSERVTADAARAPWTGATPGDYAVLSVVDQGTGMTPEVQARAFEPYFSTKAAGRGTGLGLSSCYAIARAAGGAMVVSSQVGQGTRAELWLPKTERPLPSEPAAQSTRPRLGTREVILLVEDEALVRSVCARLLRSVGYTVLEADGGAKALELLRSHRDRVRLVLSDVRMPGMSGVQLSAEVNRLAPGLPVLLASGYAEELEGRRDLDVLAKPYMPDVLLQRVRCALDAGGPAATSPARPQPGAPPEN